MLLTLLRQMGGSEYVDYHQVLEQVLRETGGQVAPGLSAAADSARMVESGQGRPGGTATGRDGARDAQGGFVRDEDDLVD
jgi:hypothetical protein